MLGNIASECVIRIWYVDVIISIIPFSSVISSVYIIFSFSSNNLNKKSEDREDI